MPPMLLDNAERLSKDPSDNSARVISPLELRADEVHVWLATLDEHPVNSLRLLLTADELARADRFHFDKDRNHFTVARGLLRKLLASYLAAEPADLRFSYAQKGKPALEGSQLNFNLAHSHGMAVYAFALGREVGIDLEFIREDLADEKIAERFFSQSEIEGLTKLPLELRKQAFFDCWTRKEAYIKARGEGLSMPLDEFDVSLAPGAEAALLRNHKEPEEVRRWTMRSLEMPAGYVAALVASGQGWKAKVFAVDQTLT